MENRKLIEHGTDFGRNHAGRPPWRHKNDGFPFFSLVLSSNTSVDVDWAKQRHFLRHDESPTSLELATEEEDTISSSWRPFQPTRFLPSRQRLRLRMLRVAWCVEAWRVWLPRYDWWHSLVGSPCFVVTPIHASHCSTRGKSQGPCCSLERHYFCHVPDMVLGPSPHWFFSSVLTLDRLTHTFSFSFIVSQHLSPFRLPLDRHESLGPHSYAFANGWTWRWSWPEG